eukprot:TRINITY_DN5426_c0_g1_i1.p1 TRINITY_DN5426_c0_g1~~TRINITY_DN5426_c0_g1_i1.p1  ORF type:complete len:522 (+),score=116.25 TRINITY_DN5426_c0_g1_i1:120-1685(+)
MEERSSDFVKYWPKSPAFDYGCIFLSHKIVPIDIDVLTRLVTDFPCDVMLWKDWEKLAVDTVGLSSPQTLALWDTFCVLKGILSGEVPLLEFVMFLFVQTYHHAVHVSPKQSEPEGWPDGDETGRRVRMRLSPTRYVVLQTKASSETAHLSFIKHHLRELLELLSIRSGSITRNALEALGFLVGAGDDFAKPFPSILAVSQFKIKRSFTVPEIYRSIAPYLEGNEFLYPHASSQFLRVGPRALVVDGEVSEPGRAAATIEETHGSNMLLLKDISKGVCIHESERHHGKDVKVFCCQQCAIYLLGWYHHVELFGCTGCQVVVGPCQSVHLEHCEDVALSTCCKGLRVSSSQDCVCHVCVNTHPIFTGVNSRIVMGPFNTFYGDLEDHMAAIGIDPLSSMWNEPLILSKHESAAQSCVLEDPSAFRPICVPVASRGKTVSNPCPLPEPFVLSLQERLRDVDRLGMEIRTACSEHPDVAEDLQQAIEAGFKDWLVSTGNIRQLFNLVHMSGSSSSASNSFDGSG